MVWVVVRVRELDIECGYEGEVRGCQDVLFAETVEGTLDGLTVKPGSTSDDKHVHDPPNHYKKKANKVHWACAYKTKPRKGLLVLDGGRKESERKVKNETHGRIEDVSGVWKRWRCHPACVEARSLVGNCRPRH